MKEENVMQQAHIPLEFPGFIATSTWDLGFLTAVGVLCKGASVGNDFLGVRLVANLSGSNYRKLSPLAPRGLLLYALGEGTSG